jgi:biopolymer transport protein ExbB
MGLLTLLKQGGWMMIPLLLCSVLSVATIIERLLYFLRLTRRGERLSAELRTAVREGVAAEAAARARAILQAYSGPLPETLHAGVEALDQGESLRGIEIAMEEGAQSAFLTARRGLPLLDTIITVAPLLGLLGTITGMMGTFQAVAQRMAARPGADTSGVTGGIAEALIATAAGIAIAVVTLVFYNAFNAQVENLLSETELRCTQFLRALEKRFGSEREAPIMANGHTVPAALEPAAETLQR